MDGKITRLTLSNGLLVILKEVHTAPLISHWLWYRVGSRNELPGGTGLSHWVEHMQFKGTQRFPTGVLDKAISRNGGVWNAFTYLDWTAFYETLPADKINLALQLEADRMENSLFESEEVETERTVIIAERRGNENEPTFRLSEAVHAAAFQVHPYQHEIIGSLADLQTIQRDELYHYYRSFYIPNNATLTLAGDFETAAMLESLNELYGALQPGKLPMRRPEPEPGQFEQRVVQIDGPGETTYVEIGYHVPAAIHPDFLALNVASSLLSGASDLSIFGGGLSNKTSRLYRALVETELAVSVYGGLQATIDPYLYSLSIISHPDSQPEHGIAALDHEIERLHERLVSQEELSRAVKQARALFVYNSESITHQASWMGFVEMFADQDWLNGHLERLSAVTPEDIQRVARKYLQPQNRVVGVYYPTGEDV